MDGARWDSFRPRPGDVVISTSYKAGTTWLQAIRAALVFQQPEPPRPRGEVLALLEAQEHRRYIKAHLPLDGLRYLARGA